MNNAKQTAQAIRTALKKQDIKACVFMTTHCGDSVVNVATPSYNDLFTAEKIKFFCSVAVDLGCTEVMGGEIDIELQSTLTDSRQWVFY